MEHLIRPIKETQSKSVRETKFVMKFGGSSIHYVQCMYIVHHQAVNIGLFCSANSRPTNVVAKFVQYM